MNRRERRAKGKGRGGAAGGPTATNAEALFRAGFAHQRAGRPAEALALYRQVLALRPEEPEVLHLAGVAAYEQDDFATAAEWIGRAAVRLPGRPEFHNNLGNALQGLGRTDEAEAAFRRALALAPVTPAPPSTSAPRWRRPAGATRPPGGTDRSWPSTRRTSRRCSAWET